MIGLGAAQRFDDNDQARHFAEQVVGGGDGVHAAGHPLGAGKGDRVGARFAWRFSFVTTCPALPTKPAMHDQAQDREDRHERDLAVAGGASGGASVVGGASGECYSSVP